MVVKGKKISLKEFIGDDRAQFIPEASLPTAPRAREEGDDGRSGRGGYGGGGGRGGYDRDASRSDQSDQWRGDRSGDRGGDRFGSRGGDRGGFRGRDEPEGPWRGGSGRDAGPSRYDRPSQDMREPEERPSRARLNLLPRSGGGNDGPRFSDRSSPSDGPPSTDKWSRAFGSGGGSGRRDERESSGRFGSRFDRDEPSSGRFDRGGDGGRFDRNDREYRDERPLSSDVRNMRLDDGDRRGGASAASSESEAPSDKKVRAKKMREERKQKAEEERKAAEEAKRKAAEEKKIKEEEQKKQAEVDRKTMDELLKGGQKGEELTAAAKKLFKTTGRPTGGVVFEAVVNAAEDVAKKSANWIAPSAYGDFLQYVMADTDKTNQMMALFSLQAFLHKHGFPSQLMEKMFSALYSLDIIEEEGFVEYKYEVNVDVPGRTKALFQLSNWFTWLETPEDEDDEDDEE